MISGLKLFEPTVFGDERGFFFESFNQRRFEQAVGEPLSFVQDNHSRSSKGVLRGLHYQCSPSLQGKLVRVSLGAVFDVVVDIRADSPSIGQWQGFLLSAENAHQLWVPPGFAHGFLTLSDYAEVQYKVTSYYDPAAERCLKWDDSTVGIQWPFAEYGIEPEAVIVSEKDAVGRPFADIDRI